MRITSEITINKKDIINWVSKSYSISCLQAIRSKTNKRIKVLVGNSSYNPLSNIPIWIKRIVLQPLFIEQKKIENKPRGEWLK